MTLPSTVSRVDYPGAGSTGPFPITYYWQSDADILVTIRRTSGAEDVLVQTTDYTLSGAGSPSGGSLTLIVALATGERMTIARVPALDQLTSIRNQGPFFPGTLEDALDRMSMRLQALEDQIGRSFGLGETYNPASYSLRRVQPVTGQVLVWQDNTTLGSATLDASATALPGEARTVPTLTAYLADNAVYNVMDYGAKGDGVTNDYAAFAAALAAAGDRGGVVYLPPRPSNAYYRIDATPGPLLVTPGITILGSMARFRSSRIAHVGGAVLFDATDGFETRRISGICIYSGGSGFTGIRVRCSEMRIDNVYFDRYTGSTCILFDDSPTSAEGPDNCWVENVITQCWDGANSSVDYGIHATGAWNNSHILNCAIQGAKIAGIFIEEGNGSSVRNTNLEHCESSGGGAAYGVLVSGNAHGCSAITLDTLEIESSYSAGIKLTQVIGCLISNVYVNANGLYHAAAYNIDIEDGGGTGALVAGVVVVASSLNNAATAAVNIVGTTDVALIGLSPGAVVAGTSSTRFAGKVTVGSLAASMYGKTIDYSLATTGLVPDGGVFLIAAMQQGAALLTDATTGETAWVVLGGSSPAPHIVYQTAGSEFTVTLDNAGTSNIIYSAGNFEVQNKTGGAKEYRVASLFGK